MAENSKIEWCDHTWSPWEGCTKVSPACDHCYAAARNGRFSRGVNWGPGAPRRRTADWRKPQRWNDAAAASGRRVSVFPSICDPFDNEVPQLWRTALFALIHDTPHLDWLLLTKRIGNAADMLRADPPEGINMAALPNLWIGATVVNQAEADRDIPKLLAVPARVRFLSIEPMLGPIDLTRIDINGHSELYPLKGTTGCEDDDGDPTPDLPRIDWVIAGGESGPHARPAHPDWFRSLRDQCAAAGVPFLFKQWGEWTPGENVERQRGTVDTAFLWDDKWSIRPLNLTTDHGHIDDQPDLYRVGKKAAGRLLDGVEHNGVPTP